jgi:EcsC protein family
MKRRTQTHRGRLTDYEAEQVRQIAAWKSEPPNPLSELWRIVTQPGAKVLEMVIPDRLVRAAIEKTDDAAELMAGHEDIQRQAGVRDLSELRDRPLEECDRLARQVGLAAQAIAIAEGAATGAGGVATTLFDIPLLFTLALRTIRKIGHCYGYPLEDVRGRRLVLAILLIAFSGTLAVRRQRLNQLRELEDLVIEEAEEDLIVQEALSLLFQLEVFEEVPGAGAISGAVLNVTFMHRVDVAARRVFQERWLVHGGKVDEIEPAEVPPRALATGLTGALRRAAYSGCYAIGYGVALPFYAAAAVVGPMNNALTRGIRDGAAAAAHEADRTVDGAWTAIASLRPRRRPARALTA